MKILLVNFEFPPLGGGGGVATSQIAQELAKRHEVHVLTTAFSELAKEEVLDGIHVHRVSVLGRKDLPTATLLSLLTFAPSALLRGISLMKSIRFDVIHAQFVIPSGLPAAFLAKIFHVPFVLTFIGGDIYDPSKRFSPHRNFLLRSVIRWIAHQADVRTAISHDTKTRTIELHGVVEDIQVIPIGLVPLIKRTATKTQYGIPEDAFLCVTIGRLVPRKGYDVLLEAWRQLPHAHLIIMGDGPLRAGLEADVVRYGLSDRVKLLGHVSEETKQELLYCADTYVSAAQHEGFGIVFLEAMDAGLPIIAANDGGQRDFLTHGIHALLVAPHDAISLAQAIKTLSSNPKMRSQMSERNRKDVQQYYLVTTAAQFENALVDALSRYGHHH